MTEHASDGRAEQAPFPTRAALLAWVEAQGLGHLLRLGLEAAACSVERAEWAGLRAAGVGRRLIELASEDALAATPIPARLKELLAPRVWAFLKDESEAARVGRSEVGERTARPDDAATGVVHDVLLRLRDAVPPRTAARPRAGLSPTTLRFDAALPGFRFVDPHPWESLPRSSSGLVRPEVALALGPEAPRVECSCGAVGCVHALAAIDAALYWLKQPRTAEDAGTIEALTQPAWRRALVALDRALTGEDPKGGVELTWRLRVLDEATCEVVPWVHKVGKKGKVGQPAPLGRQRLLSEHGDALSPRDSRVAALLPLDGPIASRAILEALVDHPRVVLADSPEQRVQVERAAVGLVAEDRHGVVRLTAGVDGAPLAAARVDAIRRGRVDALHFVFDGRRLTLLDLRPELRNALVVLREQGDRFPKEAHAALLQSMSKWAERLPVAMPRSVMGEAVAPGLAPVLRLTAQQNGAVHVEVLIRPLPGGPAMVPGRGVRDVHLRGDGGALHAVRDLAQELLATRALVAELPLARAEALEDLPFQFRFATADVALDLVAACAAREPAPELEWVGAPLRVVGRASPTALRLAVRRKGDWFGVLGGLSVEGERVELARLLDAVRRKERHVEISGRSYVELDEALRRHLAALGDHVRTHGGSAEVGPPASAALRALEREGATLDRDPQWASLSAREEEARHAPVSVPGELRAELRSYQVEGFQWLARLGASGAGAVLADDMGLGKTVQTLALLLARSSTGAAIVVVPTSVAFNWMEEAERFAPSLRWVHYADASDRDATLRSLGPGDVLLVSYGVLLRDRERFAGLRVATAVFDEAQWLKNATSQRFRAAKGLAAELAVALTGTPIENNLGELWSLFHLVLPGLFGSWESFRRRFGSIEKHLDPEAGPALARLIAPYLLRRTKAEVAAELPPRTEVKVAVTLSAPEWDLYEDARLAALSELETRRSKLREQERRVDVLAALTRLRLLASHPKLYDARSELESAKLERLLELVDELRAEGQRALIFSQFTSHLALVKQALDRSGIEYLSLDGQTPARERGALVQAFQEGTAPLFLISLKAGGVGLNLTAATNVIHLDPWWNPAVEDQASDRAHRLGQTQPVTVYRMVALGTIEEKMLALHSRKRALVAAVLDGEVGGAALSTDELVGLLGAPR